MQGIQLDALVVRARSEEVHNVRAPTLIQETEEPPRYHQILRDEYLRNAAREGILFPRSPFHRCGDAVPQAKPKQFPCQIVDV